MTTDEAYDLAEQVDALRERLCEAFPCESCDGQGGSAGHDVPYPEPCADCWGRGWSIPDDEDDE